ncbi:glycosyl transferase, group 2 family protein [Synechococcus sp. PCC 7335]|uniref:glycosyltransferase family 2 protein n=1 Tax=Synechococcus sp. (strain ATCC 29403 / PCC 7335) TaxID=91464 RepID=UPI00017ECB4C|nr:glycosyltransferase family 2 protein [Synechococcus sp. PCC 7335]EDX85312.1 glycosyl transferase, group 2 family protein [Synechococcus sp. PCC 7335]
MQTLLTIIIPTYNRPQMVERAVQSALAQTIDTAAEGIEVLVVDDHSPAPLSLLEHPRLRVIRLPENRGGAAARNEGARLASGRYITYLDDDDQLLPGMAEVAIKALRDSTLPPPVGVLSGIEVVNQSGQVLRTRRPPILPKGSHFSLEKISPDKSFLTKQTLVVEKEVLLAIGGFDETFRSRVHSELFLRLNQVCSLVGLPTTTYRLMAHEGPRVSSNLGLRQASFKQLVSKHRELFEAHPEQFAKFLYDHARKSSTLGQRQAALKALAWAFKVHPLHSSLLAGRDIKARLVKRMAA